MWRLHIDYEYVLGTNANGSWGIDKLNPQYIIARSIHQREPGMCDISATLSGEALLAIFASSCRAMAQVQPTARRRASKICSFICKPCAKPFRKACVALTPCRGRALP
mmetsp:Transcript_59126/g.93783  ORF Transcript_59126/g.93783 Transcript_59126/m.93783 type:complete len:108 (-) Transcript_59126:1657-1980(-)